jgi:iron(III) transport system ATP-binding protein
VSTVVLEARGVTRRFGRMAALDEASLELHAGEIAALIGPSGSGKSTLLRVMAGLEPVDAGEVREAGALVSSARARVPAERRQIGLVFQDFALFPHLDARANVAFGLTGKADALRQAEGWLGKVGLAHKARAFPHQLSGGEQQRVALARALAPQPRALLLDEPFSGLDPFLRADLQESTVETLRATGTSALVVSHDTEEALAIADRVAVMDRGRVAQTGAPSQVHDNPASLAVARALGPICTLPAHADGRLATTPLGTFPTALSGPAILAARPEAIALAPDPHGAFTITSIRGVGLHRTIHLTDGTHRLIAFVDLPLVPPPGARVTPTIAPGSAHVFADPAG